MTYTVMIIRRQYSDVPHTVLGLPDEFDTVSAIEHEFPKAHTIELGGGTFVDGATHDTYLFDICKIKEIGTKR